MHLLVAADQWLQAWVVAHRLSALTPVMIAASMAGAGGRLWLVTGLSLTGLRRITILNLLQLAVAIAIAAVTTDLILKPAIARERPYAQPSHAAVLTTPPNDASFPSGHTANAFAGASTLAVLLPAWQPLWWALATLIAFSRVYVGVHYPLDVIGGACVGAASAVVASRLIAKFNQPNA